MSNTQKSKCLKTENRIKGRGQMTCVKHAEFYNHANVAFMIHELYFNYRHSIKTSAQFEFLHLNACKCKCSKTENGVKERGQSTCVKHAELYPQADVVIMRQALYFMEC